MARDASKLEVIVPTPKRDRHNFSARSRHFDQATDRQRGREQGAGPDAASDRGWTREELYERKPASFERGRSQI